jgi:serine/threonine kinase 38
MREFLLQLSRCLGAIVQIVNWRSHLKFPEEAKLSPEAKDLINKLLCNVDLRLGMKGAHEIKVKFV